MNIKQRLSDKADELKSKDPVEFWPVAIVAVSVMLGFWLRYRPSQGMQYLQALDPYMIYRMSQHLALEGNLPQLDFLRYFPYPTPTYVMNQGDFLIPSVLYVLGPQFFMDYLTWAHVYPALMGAGGVLAAYYFGKELWDEYAGASMAFMLAVIAGAMHRTSAGFFEKEPVGTFMMMWSLYFFTRAWRREDMLAGIGAGLTLGLFTISWGGSKMLWLLFPLVTGLTILMDVDIRNLVLAYTPTVLVGGGIGAAFNHSRFWFSGSLFIANLGLLALLWTRYSVEEFDLVKKENLPYVTPGLSLLGLFLALLSPLYSNFVATRVWRVFGKLQQSSGGVIAGTVAENQAAGLGQILSQLGAGLSATVGQPLAQAGVPGPLAGLIATLMSLLSNIAGTWPLAFVGIPMMATGILLMVSNRYGLVEDTIDRSSFLYIFSGVYLMWLIVFGFFFQSSGLIVAMMPATLLAVGAAILAWSLDLFDEVRIEQKWYRILPLVLVFTNIVAAVAKSRLVFLASFSVAVASGYAFSRGYIHLKEYDWSQVTDRFTSRGTYAILGLVILVVGSVNLASGFAQSERLGGSPNGAWVDSLETLEDNTGEGAVLLSWWDYGYWFESIGRRAAVADGGNFGYYSDTGTKVNYPIADYFTSSSTEPPELLEKHSVDYIVLDSTMIGKYSAVSQISNRDNSEFGAMRTISTRGSLARSLARNNGTAVFSRSRLPRTQIYVELDPRTAGIASATLDSPYGRGEIGCVLTDSGVRELDVDNPVEVPAGLFGSERGRTEICVAEHPQRSIRAGLVTAQDQNPRNDRRASIVLVKKSMVDDNLVRLYLMNGAGLDYVEPYREASNGYVRVWNVTTSEE